MYPVDELRPHARARVVAMVAQEATCSDGRHRERPARTTDASDHDVRAALGAVDALAWADSLPEGVDTLIGFGHHPVSTTRAEQLALARLVCLDPAVVVLDEATAELDPGAAARTERHLHAALGQRTVVTIAPGVEVGGNAVVLIAGPCSVESEEQILTAARMVRAAGASCLRGGAFKPRSSPYSFQGMGKRALELLAMARRETGLAVVTEAMDEEQADLVAEYADCIQVGARNMQNYSRLKHLGRVGKPGRRFHGRGHEGVRRPEPPQSVALHDLAPSALVLAEAVYLRIRPDKITGLSGVAADDRVGAQRAGAVGTGERHHVDGPLVSTPEGVTAHRHGRPNTRSWQARVSCALHASRNGSTEEDGCPGSGSRGRPSTSRNTPFVSSGTTSWPRRRSCQ